MPDVLAAMPATAEHRLAARMALLFPVTIGVLFLFWFVSGLVGLIRTAPAAAVLTEAGWGQGLATASVVFWAVVDIALAALLLVRRHARSACLGMIAVSLVYLAAATAVTPGLWLDPLGPLIKVLPSVVLAAVARAMLETR